TEGYEYGSFHFLEPSFLHNYTDSTVALRSDVDLSGLKLIKMDSNFKEISKVDLGIVHSGGDQFKDDKYYVYSGEGYPEKKFSGELSVYQLDTWEKIGSLILPIGPKKFNVSGFTVL
ncbi:kelch repeat-containing protein, partial [Paenibacillus larvae subsp. larvae]